MVVYFVSFSQCESVVVALIFMFAVVTNCNVVLLLTMSKVVKYFEIAVFLASYLNVLHVKLMQLRT
jgi:hypothetical protein